MSLVWGVADVQGLGLYVSSGNKARGATGLNPPTGDPFYIDYVAHELGHQFGGNHTQNNDCNRNAMLRRWNQEVLQPSWGMLEYVHQMCNPIVMHYMHGISLQEIATVINNGNCEAIISTDNTAPVVLNVPNYTIPISTPFVLTATATDGDNDPLTYCWEQWDQEVGAVMPPVSTNAVGPMFRSLLPIFITKQIFS